MDQQIAVPIISIDLDGVVWYSGRMIDGSIETLHFLTQDLIIVDQQKFSSLPVGLSLPFFFLTNSGASTETLIAKQINQKLRLPESQEVNAEHMILNYTPLRQEMLKYSEKIVLVHGFENTAEILIDCGIRNYITIVEYAMLYPFLVPNNVFSDEDQRQTRITIKERLQITDDKIFESFIQVHAVFLSYFANSLEIVAQIIIDVLGTCDGRIADKFPQKGPDTHIPVYSIANDYFFPPRNFHTVRLGFGMFMDAICQIYKKTYNKELEVQRCGKPSRKTFEYCVEKSQEIASRNNLKISQHYMIGDNPHTDIRGAKQLGWVTILVRTGVYQGTEILDKDEEPDIIVDDFREAIKYIYEREGIYCSL